jgi:hypothetical protein
MSRFLNLIRNFSQHHRHGFFYNRENEIYRQNFDSFRARTVFNRADSL